MRNATPDSCQTRSTPLRRIRRWCPALLSLGFVALLAIVIWHGLSIETFETLHPLALLLAMVLLPALGFPMTPFYVIAGVRFGIPAGLVFAVVATLLNLLLCYAVAHGRLRPALRDAIERRFPAMAHLHRDRADAWRMTLLIKLVPGVPMFIKHYALGVAGVPRSIYLTVALMTTGPYAVAFVVLGKSALEGNVGQMLVAFALLALFIVTLKMTLGYRTRRRASRPAVS